MDFKFKGRTWAGNIYHRFETMCQEVDDFVTKDSVKYVENQVQTVGESMKKLYSNVVHDFLPPVVDNKTNEGQDATKKQNDVLGTYIRSMVGIKGKCGRANEKKSFKEQGNASEVNHQRQLSLPTNLTFHQKAETDFYSEGGGDICISKNAEVVCEENITQEECPCPVSRFSSSQDEKSSLNLRDQYPLSESLGSPEDENLSGSTEISNDRDQRSILPTNCSPEKFVDNSDFRTSQKDETATNSDDLSEETKTGLSLEKDGFNSIYKNTKMGPEESATSKKHFVSEGANTFKEKDSFELKSCTKEQHQMADDLHFPQYENSLAPSSANEDFKYNIRGKLSPVMLGHDAGLRAVQMEETVCNNADPSKEAGANISSEQHDNAAKLGFNLEENVAKDVPLSNDKSCFKLSLEHHPWFEELNNREDQNFCESSLIPSNENTKVTIWAEFPPATSVHDQDLRDFQHKEILCDIVDPLKETEKGVPLEIDGESICMRSDLAGEENRTLAKYAVEESISSLELKNSSDMSLYSTKLHLQAEELDSLENDNLLKSPPLSDRDHKNTILTNFSQAMSVHDAEIRASKTDETMCSPNTSFEPLSSNTYIENKMAESEVTSLNSSVSMESLNLPDLSYANCTQKAEKSCYNHTDSSSWVSYISSISSGSFSEFAYDNKAVNRIPGFSSRAVSTVTGHGDDSAVDIADPNMETIDLSDEVNLDESCIVVDNRLHYAASCRPRKFRSYKKLIQDAFASRKRLIKEYEQLAIWYGDIETETCPRPKQSLLPPVTAPPSSSRTSQPSDMCEPEWELL